MNEFQYIFTWLLIIVGLGIGVYMGTLMSRQLKRKQLRCESNYAKIIGYGYILASIVAILLYKV